MTAPRVLDAYNLRARLLPAIVAGAPVLVASALLVPWNSFGLPQVLSGLVSAAALVVFADLARRQGTRLQNELFAKWGGAPSTVMLRDDDQTFDVDTKRAYRAFLAGRVPGGGPPPGADTATLDGFYDRCGNWLRENTRDRKKFSILFDENITYGFRRNLFGLRLPSLILDVITAIGCAIALVIFGSLASDATKLIAVIAFAVLHAGFIWCAVTEKSVREAANQYARQLLLSCETLGAVAPRARVKAKAPK
jgi:hypothetical protein